MVAFWFRFRVLFFQGLELLVLLIKVENSAFSRFWVEPREGKRKACFGLYTVQGFTCFLTASFEVVCPLYSECFFFWGGGGSRNKVLS